MAFVQPSGPHAGPWAYGTVTRYQINSEGTWLSVLAGDTTVAVKLSEPLSIIKADPITYALQVGATVSDMVLNPRELLAQQDAVIGSCRKRRGELPASVRSMLTVPFVPDELIWLMRPHDLGVVSVRRQHVLDCQMGARKKNTLDLYRDPQSISQRASEAPADQGGVDASLADELLSLASTSDEEDIRDVRQLNRTPGKRSRTLEPCREERRNRRLQEDTDNNSDSDDDQGRGHFRPSATQRRVNRTILQSRFQGKSHQYVLERMQQSGSAQIPRLPPVCRGLWEFGFLARGLNLMHCRPSNLWDRVQAQESTVSYTDFSERNVLRAAPVATSRNDVCSALRNLRSFAQQFYVEAVAELIDAALDFAEQFKGIQEGDSVGWKLLAFWVTSKFGKFRSLIVSRDLEAAQTVLREFSRGDEDLLEILELRRSHRNGEHGAHRTGEHSTLRNHGGQEGLRRGDRQKRQSSVPTAVWAALPSQGDKKLCMKSISVIGCSSNGAGGCYDNKRAHFRPTSLPDIVKAFIVERYRGVASDPKPEAKEQ